MVQPFCCETAPVVATAATAAARAAAGAGCLRRFSKSCGRAMKSLKMALAPAVLWLLLPTAAASLVSAVWYVLFLHIVVAAAAELVAAAEGVLYRAFGIGGGRCWCCSDSVAKRKSTWFKIVLRLHTVVTRNCKSPQQRYPSCRFFIVVFWMSLATNLVNP